MTGLGVDRSHHTDDLIAHRLLTSAAAVDGGRTTPASFERWWGERGVAQWQTVRRIPFDELKNWRFDYGTGDLEHNTGRFFRVQGLEVVSDVGPVREWHQPIINQPEIGVLGILVREIDGVLHCLMQAKMEPGNINGVQLSPTVQATKSNYQKVHGGSATPYLSYFHNASPEHVIADVLQSEQGSWFYQKRNRNMVVEVPGGVEDHEDFCWLTLGQLHRLLRLPNLVNMDARTVLSCLPYRLLPCPDDRHPLADAVARSSEGGEGGVHPTRSVLSWITSAQSRHECRASIIPLDWARGWTRSTTSVAHETGRFFSVVAVDVAASAREVASWRQPLLEPHGLGEVAMLVARIDGVLHGLVQARVEPGFLDVVELAPTVQYTPSSYEAFGSSSRPPFADALDDVPPEACVYDCELSEEGGRFLHARSRYRIVEVDPDVAVGRAEQDYRWMTLAQLTDLLRFSHYLNVQLRTIVAAMRGLGDRG